MWKFYEQFLHFLNNDPSQTVATARIAPKTWQGLTSTFASHCSRYPPNRFTFSGVICRTHEDRFCPCRVFTI